MYKLIVNGIQIGNYTSTKEVVKDAVLCASHFKKGLRSVEWIKNTLKIASADWDF